MNKYKIKGLPWSLGIGRDVTDCTTSAEVMEKAGLNFTVKKCELVARMPMKLSKESLDALNLDENAGDFIRDRQVFRTCPDAYATYRTDLGIPLGIVKSKYEEEEYKGFIYVKKINNIGNETKTTETKWQ